MTPDIIEFTTDSSFLGLSLSAAQECLLRAIYGLSLNAEQFDLWRQCTGRQTYPARPFGEATILAGARAGKDSRIASPIVAYEAVFGGHERELGKGERAVFPLVAQDTRGAQVAFGYVSDGFTRSPLLRRLLAEPPLTSELRLTNGSRIACYPCTLRSLRGFSIPAACLDEVGFWRLEGSADADVEIQASLRRGMLGFTHPRVVKISTPYMRSGLLHDDYKRAFGQDDPDLLVWKSTSAQMNPTLTPERLERERRLDPQRFAREYEAEFAEDISTFLPAAWVDQAVMAGVHEIGPQAGVSECTAAVDVSGGGNDAFTLAIVFPEGPPGHEERCIVQCVGRSWGGKGQSIDLRAVVGEIATLARKYGVSAVHGDAYAAGWTRQAFEAAGLQYLDAQYSRSEAYLEVEPLFAQNRIGILDDPVLHRELKLLERRPRPGGKTTVDHPSGSAHHDDRANALCLAAAHAARWLDRPRCTWCQTPNCSGLHFLSGGVAI
jgi:hypothetical protein